MQLYHNNLPISLGLGFRDDDVHLYRISGEDSCGLRQKDSTIMCQFWKAKFVNFFTFVSMNIKL